MDLGEFSKVEIVVYFVLVYLFVVKFQERFPDIVELKALVVHFVLNLEVPLLEIVEFEPEACGANWLIDLEIWEVRNWKNIARPNLGHVLKL